MKDSQITMFQRVAEAIKDAQTDIALDAAMNIVKKEYENGSHNKVESFANVVANLAGGKFTA